MKARHAVHLAEKCFCNIIDVPLATEIVSTSRGPTPSPPDAIDLDTAVRAAIARRPELAIDGISKAHGARRRSRSSGAGISPTVSFFANLSYLYPDREYERDFYSILDARSHRAR